MRIFSIVRTYGWSSTSYHSDTESHILYHFTLYDHKNMVTTSLKTLLIKPSRTKLEWRKKKKCIIPILAFSPHVDMIMISSTLQLVDLSISTFRYHTLTFSMWSKVTLLWIDLLDNYMTEFIEHQFYLSHETHGNRRI